MPELTVAHIVFLSVVAVAGAGAGWLARHRRAAREKETVKAMWQEEIERQRKEQRRLSRQNKGLMEQISRHQVQYSSLNQRVADLSATVQDADTRHDQMQGEIEARDSKIGRLKRELRNWHERLPPLVERYRIRNEEAEQLEAELEEAQSAIRRLEELSDEANTGDGESLPESPDDESAADDIGDAGDARDAGDLEEDDAAAPDDPPPQRDNLKKIKGVGPATEKSLNEMGIFSFRQLAEMTDYDIDRVARRLKGLHGRIQREDWIGQARMLLDNTTAA